MTDQFIGKVLAEKYQINSLIGEAAMGNFYHGTHLLMEKPVAIKILPKALSTDETIVKRFANEARTISRISHPNILNVTDYGSDKDGTVFIIYEDATGENLKEAIQRVGKFPLGRANHIVKEIASALAIAHANEIIHQNLSSQNILIHQRATEAEEVKILNFGTTPFDINDLDYPIEKIQYLSPEQCKVAGEINKGTDVYALGIILYEMLAGVVPLTATNGTDLLLKQTQETPPQISAFRKDLPNEVDDILLMALAKNPTIRYQSVDELAEALNQVSLLYPDSDEQATVVNHRLSANAIVALEPPPNNIWKTAFIVLAGISLLGAFFIYLTSIKQTNPSTKMQTDANGMPVQPVNPATGSSEQGFANMDSFNPNIYTNSNTTMTDGGVTNPYWDNGQRPPGAPSTSGVGDPFPVTSVAPPGNQVYIGPDGSIFMPNESGNYVKMVPVNSNTSSNVNAQANAKKNSNSNVNTQPPPANTTVKPSPTPTAANTATPIEVKPTPTPTPTTPIKKPTPKPKTTTTPPSTTEKRPVSGKEQDT